MGPKILQLPAKDDDAPERLQATLQHLQEDGQGRRDTSRGSRLSSHAAESPAMMLKGQGGDCQGQCRCARDDVTIGCKACLPEPTNGPFYVRPRKPALAELPQEPFPHLFRPNPGQSDRHGGDQNDRIGKSEYSTGHSGISHGRAYDWLDWQVCSLVHLNRPRTPGATLDGSSG